MYLPGGGEGDADGDGGLGATALSDLQAAADAFLADTGTADIGLFILHEDVSTPAEVTSVIARPKVATQRRRLKR